MQYPRKRNNEESVSGDRGALLSFPKGALTHHRQSRRCTACGSRALYEITSEIGKEVIAYRHIPS